MKVRMRRPDAVSLDILACGQEDSSQRLTNPFLGGEGLGLGEWDGRHDLLQLHHGGLDL